MIPDSIDILVLLIMQPTKGILGKKIQALSSEAQHLDGERS